MKHRHVLLLVLAVAMGAAGSAPSWAVINNGGRNSAQDCDDPDGLLACLNTDCDTLLAHTRRGVMRACIKGCYRRYCSGPTNPAIVRNPGRGRGHPVEAPPPSRPRKPIHVPIIKGKPIHAAPTNPPAGQPILERNSGGGHRH